MLRTTRFVVFVQADDFDYWNCGRGIYLQGVQEEHEMKVCMVHILWRSRRATTLPFCFCVHCEAMWSCHIIVSYLEKRYSAFYLTCMNRGWMLLLLCLNSLAKEDDLASSLNTISLSISLFLHLVIITLSHQHCCYSSHTQHFYLRLPYQPSMRAYSLPSAIFCTFTYPYRHISPSSNPSRQSNLR